MERSGAGLVLAGFAQGAEDAGGCIGGCVSALAEQLLQGVVVFLKLLPAGVVVEEIFQFPAEVFRGEFILDQFFDDEFIHDQVDQGDIFYADEPFGDLVGNGAAFVADYFGHAEEGCFEGGGSRGDAGGLRL